MRLRLTWSGQFYPIHNFSHLLPPKHLIFGEISEIFIPQGGYIGKFFEFFNFLNRFTPKWLKMTHNGQFCQKSGLDWLQTANFGHFGGFSIFSPKMRLRLTQNGQCHPIHNFFHLLPPKHLIFGEISKILVPGWGGVGTLAKFLSFSTFSNCFTVKWLKMTHNGQFCQKSGLDWLQTACFGHFAGFSIFSPK